MLKYIQILTKCVDDVRWYLRMNLKVIERWLVYLVVFNHYALNNENLCEY